MANAHSRTALVIDDDWRVLVRTQEHLEGGGYKVTTRDRISGSVAVILKEKPDVVLIEPDMRGVSGDSLVRIVSGAGPRVDTLLFLYSELPFHELHQRAMECHADGYIQKTSSASRLISQLKHSTNRLRSGASSARLRGALYTAADEAERSMSRGADVPISRTGTVRPTVLFVDDDPSMLKIYQRDLASDEYRASFCPSGDQASLLLEGEAPPDVVVCDLLMPGVSGADLYAKALALDPTWRKRFVFTTGFGSISYISNFIDSTDAPVFRKPLDFTALRDAIRFAAIGARIFSPLARPAGSAT